MYFTDAEIEKLKQTCESHGPNTPQSALKEVLDKMAAMVQEKANAARHLGLQDEYLCIFADYWQAYSKGLVGLYDSGNPVTVGRLVKDLKKWNPNFVMGLRRDESGRYYLVEVQP